MIRAERMLEPGVSGAGINEKRMSELPHVPQALKRRGIDDGQSLGLEADVVPEGVADDLKRGARDSGLGVGGPRFEPKERRRRQTAQNSSETARLVWPPAHRTPLGLSTSCAG